MRIRIKRLNDDAILPLPPATAGSAGFDICSPVDLDGGTGSKHIRLGWSIEVPQGFVLLLTVRSSVGKAGGQLCNAPGVVDADYRGEVGLLWNGAVTIRRGQRIAQGLIVPHLQVEGFDLVEELSSTERGSGGFGSTGQ